MHTIHYDLVIMITSHTVYINRVAPRFDTCKSVKVLNRTIYTLPTDTTTTFLLLIVKKESLNDGGHTRRLPHRRSPHRHQQWHLDIVGIR